MQFKNAIFVFITLCFFSCKKEDNVNIYGNVRNNCTGKGYPNVEVFFQTYKNNSLINTAKTISDINGDFIFSNMEINKSNKYSYSIFIENHDRYLIGEYGHSGIGPVKLDKSKLNELIQIGLSASFNICKVNLPTGVIITPPDTFTLKFEQKTLHFYEPNRVYFIYCYPRFVNPGPFHSPNWRGYPMGLWHITFEKTKSGITSVINDSVYLSAGDSTSYTIPW